MQVYFLVCAQLAIVDQATNNISILNILEQAGAPIFPIALPMSVVAHLTRKKSENEKPVLRLIIKLDNRQIADHAVQFSFQGKLTARLIAQLQALPIESPGLLKVELQFRKKSLGSWNVQVYKTGEDVMLSSSFPAGPPKESAPLVGK